ncbi:hypothetical protein [Wolbachia endosymbiont of Ctenocephalides felis wCfeT]|uniref:hypothetical protein n=1 Tax=Wolbachia endosymbiont of Ctenocephalides felis wCfeT TaxID=2732593 RepID=UPI0014488443|nr:hypothetical protein [Wolbachia endosymbiont of Ctenocephalides felis wCfeT]
MSNEVSIPTVVKKPTVHTEDFKKLQSKISDLSPIPSPEKFDSERASSQNWVKGLGDLVVRKVNVELISNVNDRLDAVYAEMQAMDSKFQEEIGKVNETLSRSLPNTNLESEWVM